MNPFALITQLLAAAAAYFNWRTEEAKTNAKSANYDLSERIENDIQVKEAEILRLRAIGDPASQLLADRLRQRIARAQAVASTIPTPGPAPIGGQPGANA